MPIKFGTDGWRAVIAEDYTFANLAKVSQATGRWIIDENITKNGIVIGHDARFEGRAFAKRAAAVFAAMDIPVKFADAIAPTPAVSLACRRNEAVGIVITASHNPHQYNGFKIKATFGGPAPPSAIEVVEKHLSDYDKSLTVQPYKKYIDKGLIQEIPVTSEYLEILSERIDIKAIKESRINLAHDPMFGAGQGLLKKLLRDEQVHEIHGDFNPSFKGRPPEPIEKNLTELPGIITANNCVAGIANDGDSDRVGMFDEKGNFVSSHKLLSLLVKYLSQQKGMKGSVIKTFSTTTMLDKQAEKYGLDIETTAIGFKYIADKMANRDVLVGGEESGGIALKGHIPERDGLFIGLTIAEMIVTSGKKLSELVAELQEEFGPHYFYRNDLHTPEEQKEAVMEYCKDEKLTEIAGKKVVGWQFIDGVKHTLEDDSWLLVRKSGTEPLLRIYAEAKSLSEAKELVEEVAGKVNSF